MLSHARAAALVVAFCAAPTLTQAQSSSNLGALVVQTCTGCHGADLNGAGGMPLLRGRPAAELQIAMAEFRANQRYSTVMGRLARGLTEPEIAAVSQYIASLR